MIPYEIAHDLFTKDMIQRITLNRVSTLRRKYTKYKLLKYDEWCTAFKDGLILTIPHFQIDQRVSLEFESEKEYIGRILS